MTKALQIKQENKFFSRLLSKEENNSKGESSFRVMYYGGAAGAIPFTWESQPGTPKHTLFETSLPPLTPPPSYQSISNIKSMEKRTKSQIFHFIFPKFGSKKTNMSSPSYSSSSMSSLSWSSSSKSLPSTPMNIPFNSRRKCNNPRSRSAVYFGLDDDDYEQPGNATSPTSTLCFSARNGSHKRRSTVKNLKKAFFSIVGHGTA